MVEIPNSAQHPEPLFAPLVQARPLISQRADLRRFRIWDPLAETSDPEPFTAAAMPVTDNMDAPATQFSLLVMETTLRCVRARHSVRCWAWRHRAHVGPLIDAPGPFPRLGWVTVCHLKGTREQGDRAWALVERAVGERDEDVRQEALVHLFDHVLSDRFPGWDMKYLKAAARNVRRDLERLRAAEARLVAGDEALVHAHDAVLIAPDPADAVVERMTVDDLVGRLLTLLTPRERQVLDLRRRGYRDPEIARSLGTTTATVNTLARRIAVKARRLFA